MKAAHCLRYLSIKAIYTVDQSMERNTDWYDTLDNLLDDLDDTATTQQPPLQLARLNSTSTTSTTLGSTSPLIIHDYDDDNFDFGDYDMEPTVQSSSIDIQPLIVDFDNDFI